MKNQQRRVLDGDELTSLDMFQSIETKLIHLIAATSIWVRPDKVTLKPIYPNTKRGRAKEKGNIHDGVRIDDNTYANIAIKKNISNSIEFKNYMVCHIWPGTTYDERYHTLLANLVLIPRILANLSDYFEMVIDVLKYRSFEIYGWHPEGTEVPIRPSYYPQLWRDFITSHDSLVELGDQDTFSLFLEDEEYEQEKEALEIEKVKRKIPRWVKRPLQINSKILSIYMKLSKNGSNRVHWTELKGRYEQMYGEGFKTNYDQMKNFGRKNHAKVFSESKDGMISLWEPVAVEVKKHFD